MIAEINRNPIASSTSDQDLVVDVRGVAKKFCRSLKHSLWYGTTDVFSELFLRRRCTDTLRSHEFWAIDGVNMQIRRGEAVGLVGRNGAGKTTLLRMIAGLIRPDVGEIRTRGRVAPLLALGAGFSPILTGRENIHVNMAVLGLSSKVINDRIDAVIDFSEMEASIDAPVRTYSSGMIARLGFACAIHVEPDVLLVDEVLAVGDIAFRAKCYRRLSELLARDTAVVLVSHNPSTMLFTCDSGVLLEGGRVQTQGSIHEVVKQHEQDLLFGGGDETAKPTVSKEPSRTGLEIASVELRNATGDSVDHLTTSEPGAIVVACRAREAFENVSLNFSLRNTASVDGGSMELESIVDGRVFSISPGESELCLQLPVVCMRPGMYSGKISVSIGSLHTLDAVQSFCFRINYDKPLGQAPAYQPRSWDMRIRDQTLLRRSA
ncbi:MAG: ABC transporter ATP-binding protein [Planctomycetota bacterium]|nr:ABC transporter ATP-binding protein [Planctomycetota bacterium]